MRSRSWHGVDRRTFLRLASLASGSLISRAGSPALHASAGPAFAEVTAAASGITWVHDNAMSAGKIE